nr:carboxyl transferase domain-containing protein [Anoxybacter fermentans]
MLKEQKIRELYDKRERLMKGGGEEKIKKQHSKGKLTARERIKLLLDENSFVEVNPFMSHRCVDFGMDKVDAPGDGVVTGYGTIHGRLVFVFAQDFTVMGGSLGEIHAARICKIMDMAKEMGAPIIGLYDSGGARIQEGVLALNGFGEIFARNALCSGVVPQISVIMGPCAGGAVYSPALTDFVFMVDNTSQMFLTGPEVIKSITGEEVTMEELGGSITHAVKSGVAHFTASSEEECMEQVRRLLSFIPSNNLEDAPMGLAKNGEIFDENAVKDLIPDHPNKPYDMKKVINHLVDQGDFMEIHARFAKNIIVGFGRLNGRTVGIVANQPMHKAGCLDIDASDKASRFIRFCDAFNIPLLTLVDVPGFLPGVSQEYGGIIRHGAKLLYAYTEATVPKITLVVRKAYGGGYIAMCSKSLGADLVYAWPTAEIAVMGPEGAANIIFRKEIAAARDPEMVRQKKIAEYREQFANPYVAAKAGIVNDVLSFEETRMRLINSLEMLENKRVSKPQRKHGNMPL